MQANFVIVAVVILYMIAMLLIGFISSKRIESNTDFMVAGRRLGPLLMAGTLAATEIGGGSSLGVVEQGMKNHGLSAAWYIISMGVAFVILTFIAPKFRAAEVKTVPEFFRRRYGKTSGLVTAVIMFFPLVGLTAGQFIASSVIFSTMLGISYHKAVLVIGVVVTIYAVMGGLWSVTITDFVQVFLIVLGMIFAVPFAFRYAGGWQNIKANIPEGTLNLIDGAGKGYSFFNVISLIVMYLGTFTVGQEAVSRYYAARDGKAAKQGSILAAIINFVYAFIPTILGITVLALINMGKFSADDFAGVGARYALPVLATKAMPAVICGLLFSGIISATMSSADSDLLGAGSIFGNDIYKTVIKPSADDKEIMRVTQTMMIVVGVLATIIAYTNRSDIITILQFSFTLRAAGAFFPYVIGHYWKKSSEAGTVASLVGGTIAVLYIEKVAKGQLFGMKITQSIIPGLVVAFVCFIVFSNLFPPKEESVELKDE